MAADEGTRASARALVAKFLRLTRAFGSQAELERHHRALLQAGRLLLANASAPPPPTSAWVVSTRPPNVLASAGDRGRAVAPASPRRRAASASPRREAAALARASPAREARRPEAAREFEELSSETEPTMLHELRMFFDGAYRLRVLKQRIRDMGRSAASPLHAAVGDLQLSTDDGSDEIAAQQRNTAAPRRAKTTRRARAREPSAAPSATPESRGDAERIVRELGGTVLRLYVDGLAQSVDEQPEPSRAGAGSALQNLATATRALASAKKHTRAFFEASRLFAFVDADGSGSLDRDELVEMFRIARVPCRELDIDALAQQLSELDLTRCASNVPARNRRAKQKRAAPGREAKRAAGVANISLAGFIEWYCSDEDAWLAERRQEPIRAPTLSANSTPLARLRAVAAAAKVREDPCTDRALLGREALKWDPRVRRCIDAFWTLTDEDGSGYLDVEEYVHLWANLKRVVSSGGETRRRAAEAEAADDRRAALKEWEFDAQGADHLNYSRFALSFFQIADAWTDKVSADAYGTFLEWLLSAATVSDPAGGRRRWKWAARDALAAEAITERAEVMATGATEAVDEEAPEPAAMEAAITESGGQESETRDANGGDADDAASFGALEHKTEELLGWGGDPDQAVAEAPASEPAGTTDEEDIGNVGNVAIVEDLGGSEGEPNAADQPTKRGAAAKRSKKADAAKAATAAVATLESKAAASKAATTTSTTTKSDGPHRDRPEAEQLAPRRRTEKGRDITEELDGSPGAVTAAADPEDTEAQVDEAREVRQNDARVCGLGLNKDIRSASVPRLRRRSCPAGSRARSRAMLSTPCG